MAVVCSFIVFVCGVIGVICLDNPASGWMQMAVGSFGMIYGSVINDRKSKAQREQAELDELIRQHDEFYAEQVRFRAYMEALNREPDAPAARNAEETPENPCVPMRSGPRRVTFRRTPAKRPESPNDP